MPWKQHAFRCLNIYFCFFDVIYWNGAKHSSWFWRRYGNDGWTGLWPEFVRLVTFSWNWKIKRESFSETILLQVSISLCDILKRKLTKSDHETSRANCDLVIFWRGPKMRIFMKKKGFPISLRIIPMMFWNAESIKKHSFRLN